uniref:Endoplasmic reticulum aminopeptidase 2 n=1 Tax=Sipha flava TaxID=143950 RepID=A0A2S2QK36_9HEMI
MSPLAAAALLVYYVLSPGSRPVHGHGAGCAAACRLPAATRPESYELRLEPRTVWPAAAFNGVARIAIRARHATDVITLNAKDLDVISATVTDSRLGADVAVDRLVHRPADEQFEIRLAARVAADRAYVVTVSYGGTVRNDSTGLFAISYGEEPVTAKWLVVTDFEPTYARRVFPCYDEPVYKVVFNISVVKKKNQIALSNMPIRAIEHGPDDTETVYFESTPPMSTYLVAIYVGEFEPSKNYSKITAYTQNMYMNQTEYIGVEASKRLQVMEEYTGIEYTLPKMDMLVIPDFRAGMENWGLNIFRENYIRLQENSTTAVKMSVFKLVQHEFAHQWFGNLVTCEWWDYLWLNEGFATYFEYFATKMVCPSWPMEELFVIEIHQSALSYDQTARRSITSSVCTQDEIEDQFDVITYKKSPAVLRMLRYLVTEKLFQLSLRHYLNVNRESVAEPNDLYSSFDHVLNDNDYDLGNELTVNEFMSNWTLQPGYPVLRITKNNISNTFSVTQSRFINHEKLGETTPPAWHIGLTFTTESSKDFNYTRPCFWTNKTSTLTIIPAPENSGWFLFNIKSSGKW